MTMEILSFDIESTTGSHNDGSMCTFGYCIADSNFNVTVQKDVVMKPYTKRYESKTKLHYDKEYLSKCEQFPFFYEEIAKLFNSNYCVIGFSVMNDVDFLNNACEIYSLKKIEYQFLDVQLIYKTVYNKPTLSALSSIAEELNVEYKAHRSDEDARVTLLVLKHILSDTGYTLKELLKKYHITAGINSSTEITPCQNGTFTHREINYLILDFVKNNYQHKRYYKGGLSSKTFAFADYIRYNDVDKFRTIIKKIYMLNGRIGSIETSNVFVCDENEMTDKYARRIAERNANKQLIQVISLTELLNTLKELPKIDFSGDVETIRLYRLEVNRQRKLKKEQQANIKANSKNKKHG